MVEHTRLISGTKYLKLHNPNEFKQKSLEDNVYFTLRDIFLNYGIVDYVMRSNYFNSELSSNISFEERDIDFKYTDNLMDEKYLTNLIKFFKSIYPSEFEFETPEQYWNKDKNTNEYKQELEWYYNVDINNYIKLNDWMEQFNELIKELEIRLEKVKLWTQEDLYRDMSGLNELEAIMSE
jgi:hypothetical protein